MPPPDDTLEFAACSSLDTLGTGRFGIREPTSQHPVVSLADADVVLVPGLAFDGRGGRLGRGAGYYDRALAPIGSVDARRALIGVALSIQIVPAVPMDARDVAVDRVVTERGWGARPRDDAEEW